jgi:hypothetical protein
MAALCRDAATAIADAEAIEDCIAGTNTCVQQKGHGFDSSAGNLPYFQDRLPLRVVNH